MAKFKKGKSGNPGGRPGGIGELRDLARKHAPDVVRELARLALKAKSESTRVAAIRELLDRGFGKPVQALEHGLSPEIEDAEDLSIEITFVEPTPREPPRDGRPDHREAWGKRSSVT
jgi:hypothetical protein